MAQRKKTTRATAAKPEIDSDLPRVLVLSGPNLDRLGQREPHIYGAETLGQIHDRVALVAGELGVEVDCRQSNHEGMLIDWIGAAHEEGFSAILINAGAYTHTSLAIYDALRASPLPAVEVHLSNPAAREKFRERSVIAPACVGVVAGFRGDSYTVALWAVISSALSRLQERQRARTASKPVTRPLRSRASRRPPRSKRPAPK